MRDESAVEDLCNTISLYIDGDQFLREVASLVVDSPLCTIADQDNAHSVLLQPSGVDAESGATRGLSAVGRQATQMVAKILLREARKVQLSPGATGVMKYRYMLAVTKELGDAQIFHSLATADRKHCITIISRAVYTATAKADRERSLELQENLAQRNVDPAAQRSYCQRVGGWEASSMYNFVSEDLRKHRVSTPTARVVQCSIINS